MPTDTPDLVADYEDQKQSAPDLVGEFEQAKSAQQPQPADNSRPDFTKEALSGKLAPASGKPTAPSDTSVPAAAIPRGRGDVSQSKGGYFPPTDVPIQGVKDINEGFKGFDGLPVPNAPMPAARGQMPRPISPKPQVSPQEQAVLDQQANQRAAAATKMIQGAGEVGTIALPGALAAAPITTAASIGTGLLASKASGAAVHGKVSPQAEELIRATAFFIPSVVGTASGLKTGSIETPEGKFSAASALSGKVKAGIASTPEAYSGRVKVGDTQFEVNVPRGKAPAGPEVLPPGAQIPPPDPATAAMIQYEQGAGNIPKAPPPVPPGQQFGNKLSGDQVDHLSQTIAKAPADQQNALIEEAHTRMTQWISDNNGRVFVDGKIQIAKNPAQAETLAAKIINDASSAHDKTQIDLAKANDKAQTAAQKEQEKATDIPQPVEKTVEKPEPATAPEPTSQIAKSEPTTQNPTTNDGAKPEVAPKHDFASTQVNIDPQSELGQRHAQAVAAMPDDHIGPNGKEDTPHVTVRYGLKDDSPEAIAKIKEAASKIAPFEATVGKTGSFPATKEGDRPIIAHVDQNPELNALRSAVEGAGNFKEDTHGDYKPHVSLGYVKPQHAAAYEGGNHLEGGKVPVDHIIVSRRDGTSETIPLGGKKPVPDLVAQHEATPDLVAEHEGRRSADRGNDRREDIQQRKRVADMSPDERAKALLTSEAVDLPNRRAFDEKENSGKAPALAISDADGLKALNDNYGYAAGTALLNAKAEALKEAGLDSYHDKGDEFLHRGESSGDLKAKLEQAREILRNRIIEFKDKNTGKLRHFNGADFSYGTGKDLDTAESGLHAHKDAREAAGERARGELRGITEVGSKESGVRAGASTAGEVKPSLPEGIPAKSKAGEVATSKLTLAPKKFQYKLNTNEHGVTNLLAGQKFNPELAGVVSVWHDPADGKTYVINGHHRVQLAKQSGVKSMLVRHLNVDSASEARASGALQNIAEGRGSVVDAAKFFRERGMTPADLEQHGISMGEATAENGLALSKLDPYIFDKVVSGELSQGRGIAIGKATDNPATQEAILKLITKAEKRGRKMTDGMVSELARFANRAKETTTESGGLFGSSFRTENNALDKAEVSDYIKSQLLKEKRVFGAVSTEGKAEVLGQVKGQNIKAEQNQKIALEASQAGELYDKLSSSRGPIDDILENAAQRIAKRENPATVKADAYKQARTELRKALPGGEEPGTGGLQGRTGTGKEIEGTADRQASVKAPSDRAELRRAKSSSDEPALPGMGIEPEPETSKDIARIISAQAPKNGGWLAGIYDGDKELSMPLHFQKFTVGGRDYSWFHSSHHIRGTSMSMSNQLVVSGPDGLVGKFSMGTVGSERQAVRAAINAIKKDVATHASPALPGMAPHIEANKESAAATQGEELTKRLTEQPKSVSAKAGEMERSSPLFRDSEASGQSGLFNNSDKAVSFADLSKRQKDGAEEYLAEIGRDKWNLETSKFQPRTVSIAELEAAKNRPLYPSVKPSLAGLSRTSGPILLDNDMSVIDGMHRVADAIKAGKTSIDALVRIPASGQTGLFGDRSIKGKDSERGFASMDLPAVITKGAAESVTNFLKETSAKTAIARGVDDKLFSLSKQYEADVLRAVQLMKQVGPLSTPADQEAIYHHLEDSSVPLDDKQEALLDKIVKPLMNQSAEIRSQLNNAGVPMGEEGYVHRVVKGRSSQLERAMRGGTGTGKGNVLSSAASSTKGRIMMGLTAEGLSGRRVVVSIKGDRVTRFDNGKSTDMGPLRSGMTTKFELQDDKLAPLADKIIKIKQQIKELPENDRADQIAKVNEKIADLAKQREVLDSVKGRVKGQRASYGAEPTFNQRKAITQQTEKLVKERDRIQNTKDNSFMSNAGQEAMRRAQEHLTVAQNQRARLLEQVDPKELEDKLWVDANGKKWKINQATTKEIEKNTDLQYYHNALASTVTDYLQLLRAKRANDALESMKSDPDFNSMAFKSVKGSMPPEGWQSVALPQFRDYYFEPHMAEVLDRFAKELHPDPPTVLEKIGNFMTASLLLNPIRHIYNIGNHWLVERGASGTFNPLSWPTSAKAGVKAIKAVTTQNGDFLSALDHGAAMMSHRTDLQELNQHLFETVMGHLEKNPGIAGELARLSGWDKANESDTGALNTASRATGLRMLNNIRKLGQKAMWMSNDMFMLQSTYDKIARSPGLSFDDAMKQTEKHIPNYRIPTRVMNSKGISDFMGSRLASMFGRYHYGVWKSYFEMAKEAVGPNSTPKERLKGLDHLIMLGLLTFVGYQLWDAALKKITGNKDAHMVRSGASAIPYAMSEIMKGNKAPDELVRGTFTPAVLPQAAAEALLFNRDFFSGAPIRKKSDPAKKQAFDTAKHFANTLGPVQQAHQAKKSAHPIGSFLLSQAGVNTNHPKKHK